VNLEQLYYGGSVRQPRPTGLRAGPVSVLLEDGGLRYIRLGSVELIRRIYVAVRDSNWGTVPATLCNVKVDVSGNSFVVAFDARHQQGHIDFGWNGTIRATDDGTIRFDMKGRAATTFRRNRIGICVLHPMSCAGRRCAVEQIDGSVIEGAFPSSIAPHQPFRNIQAITARYHGGIEAQVRFAGEVFEMEDQRNWTDASFKTYGTPLDLPFPVEVPAGTTVHQSVTFGLLRAGEPTRKRTARAHTLTIGNAAQAKLPRIGLVWSPADEAMTASQVAAVRAIRPHHIRVELRLGQVGWEDQLLLAARDASAIGARMEIALFPGDDLKRNLQQLAAAVGAQSVPVHSYLLLDVLPGPGSREVNRLVRAHLAQHAEGALIGAGTDGFFAELNRNRPTLEGLDLLCYSVNPQVHATDTLSLVESLEAQRETVTSARHFARGRGVAVGPVTLKMRNNPAARHPCQTPVGEADPRQTGLFGAAWTLGSLGNLAAGGAHSVTYFETRGWKGIGPRDLRRVFPLYHVLADVGEWQDADVLPAVPSHPLQVTALALRGHRRTRIMVANLTEEAVEIEMKGIEAARTVRRLNERTAGIAMQHPAEYRAERRDPAETGRVIRILRMSPLETICIDAQAGGEGKHDS
jgi:hypothetical protein